ncbi:hypothetical protein GCM10023085_19540 [Actinomadura viridis]|uniref:Uncharacterized protein n=1 Tax=Actinomadura viridis TaxID=58110 RepID=A0A931DID9_9ACTN|nr:hypothetical protein [Actinomadura viridis]MBG6089289.1 hypothetical protein [Actinomadura viridis]
MRVAARAAHTAAHAAATAAGVVLATGALSAGVPYGALAAAGPGGLDIDPAPGPAGRFLTVAGGCETDDHHVAVTGAARGTGAVTDGWFSVRARVVPDMPGLYRLDVRCAGSGLTRAATFRVAGPPPDGPEARGRVRAGGSPAQGRDLAWPVTGVALLAGAAGVGRALLRHRAARERP